ncbi:MAG: MFS transporter [Thermoguttaceae bacterium]
MIRSSQSRSDHRPSAYGAPFWFAYAANAMTMIAIALLFRYADFITLLGGSELHLGWIVGVGMVGSLAMRLLMGLGIDHYGPRLVWLGSLAAFVVVCFAHLAITSCHGPAIYLLRIVLCCSLAGVFGASMTFISSRVSPDRVAEMIGMLGTSGFVGMVLGTQLGDFLLGSATIDRTQVQRMFLCAGLLGVGALAFAFLATLGQTRPSPKQHAGLLELLRRYHPGSVLLVGVAMGIALGLPTTFLRMFAAELQISRIGVFFGVYALAAIVTRLLTRRLPQRLGTTPMILSGMAVLVVSQLLFLLVDVEWQLVLPGIGYGVAHAIMFPSVIAAGCRLFPAEHRGLGTTLMLSTWDVGQLIGAPMAGAIVHYTGLLGLPSYPIMFATVGLLLAVVTLMYARTAGGAGLPIERTVELCPNPLADRFPDLQSAAPVVGPPQCLADDAGELAAGDRLR